MTALATARYTDKESPSIKSMQPLADKIRPRAIDEFVGQKHLVGKDKPLRLAVEQGHIFSFVL